MGTLPADRAVDLSNLTPLRHDFLCGEDVDRIAESLVGTILVVDEDEIGPVGGSIVETEAYDQGDPTAHCFKHEEYARLKTSKPMFLSGGHAYIFPASYGYCLNFVTGRSETGSAVLIRALRPLIGKRIMQIGRAPYCREALTDEALLCNTPVALCEALGVADYLNSRSLYDRPFKLYQRQSVPDIKSTARIGVAQTVRRLRPTLRNTPFAENAIKSKRRWVDLRSIGYVHKRNTIGLRVDPALS